MARSRASTSTWTESGTTTKTKDLYKTCSAAGDKPQVLVPQGLLNRVRKSTHSSRFKNQGFGLRLPEIRWHGSMIPMGTFFQSAATAEAVAAELFNSRWNERTAGGGREQCLTSPNRQLRPYPTLSASSGLPAFRLVGRAIRWLSQVCSEWMPLVMAEIEFSSMSVLSSTSRCRARRMAAK